MTCLLRILACCSGGFGCGLQSPSLQWCEKFRILVAIYKYHWDLWSIKCLTTICGTFDRTRVCLVSEVTLPRHSDHPWGFECMLNKAVRHLSQCQHYLSIFERDILCMMIVHMVARPRSLCRYRKIGSLSDTYVKATRFRYFLNSPKSGCAELHCREYGCPFSYAYSLIRSVIVKPNKEYVWSRNISTVSSPPYYSLFGKP